MRGSNRDEQEHQSIGGATQLADEFRALKLPQGRSALCLSGGGIRSATFCLGVIQALARFGWLNRFDYLSTVSGGGYIGSWLTSWIRRTSDAGRESIDLVMESLATVAQGKEPEEVRRLRAYSNYLSPVTGISADSRALVAAFLRNLLIVWVLLAPMLAFLVSVPLAQTAIVGSVWALDVADRTSVIWAFAVAAVLVVFALAYSASDLPERRTHQTTGDHFIGFGLVPLLAACVVVTWAAPLLVTHIPPARGSSGWERLIAGWPWMLAGGIAHSIAVWIGRFWRYARKRHDVNNPKRPSKLRGVWATAWAFLAGSLSGLVLWAGFLLIEGVRSKGQGALDLWQMVYATLAVPYLLAAFSLGSVLYMVLMRGRTDEGAREWWGRAGGYWLATSVVWVAAHLVAIWIPALLVTATLGAASYLAVVGAAGGSAGVFTAVVGYFSKRSVRTDDTVKGSWFDRLGVGLLEIAALLFVLTLLVVVSMILISLLGDLLPSRRELTSEHPVEMFRHFVAPLASSLTDHWPRWVSAMIVTLFMTVAVAWLIGVNTFSMHALYSNRLTRAYLGATRERSGRAPHAFTGFDPADDIALADFGYSERRPLFHVINTALNITKPVDGRLEWQERKAASFPLTPLHAGSEPTGYCSTEDFSGGDYGPPRIGGTDRDIRGISLGKAFAISGAAASPNMGYHTSALVAFVMTFFNVRLGWWVTNPRKGDARMLSRDEPRNALGALLSELTGSSRETTESVYLSDGGHFENLGLYEMVRRRCSKIMVVDASCDPGFEFEDLERAIRLIRTDFGFDIEFNAGLPTEESVRQTKCHYAVGEIRYPAEGGSQADTGKIIYVKPSLSDGLPMDVLRFAQRMRERGRRFPHESTGDQFFSESQFESYRSLGTASLAALEKNEQGKARDWDSLWETKPPDHAAAGVNGQTAPIRPASCDARGSSKLANLGAALTSKLTWDTAPAWLALLASPFVVTAVATGPSTPEPQTSQVLVVNVAHVPSWQTHVARIDSVEQLAVLIAKGDRRIMLPMFEEARGDCATGTCRFGERPDSAGEHVMTEIGEYLATKCRASKDPLRIVVRGYSSSSDFRGEKGIDNQSGERNVELAMRRASNVVGILKKQPGLAPELAQRWESYDALRSALIPDALSGTYYTATGGLNRRVDLELEDIGSCTLTGIWEHLKAGSKTVSGGVR